MGYWFIDSSTNLFLLLYSAVMEERNWLKYTLIWAHPKMKNNNNNAL